VVRGKFDIEELLGEDGARQARIPSIDSTHFTIIASELEALPPAWSSVEGRKIVTLSRTDDPAAEPI
jgi:hypothetical protein